MREKSQSEVAQSCPTLSDPMDCSPPGSSVHGIFQARVLEWGASAVLHCVNCDSIIVIINQLLSLFFFFKTALSILVSLYMH